MLGLNLGVPLVKCNEIGSKYPTDEKQKEALMHHWLCYCPGVSWGKLAGELYFMEEKQSLQLVQRHLKKTAGMLMMILYWATVIKLVSHHKIPTAMNMHSNINPYTYLLGMA